MVDPKRLTYSGTFGRMNTTVLIRAITRKILAESVSQHRPRLAFLAIIALKREVQLVMAGVDARKFPRRKTSNKPLRLHYPAAAVRR